MPNPTIDPEALSWLRQRAQQQLAAGTAPTTRAGGMGVEALALLHRLASNPDSAADALKLLHELQVHQVELDLQQAQLEFTERELASELTHYRALFEHAPIAHCVIDGAGRILRCNRAGIGLLGGGDVGGRRFDAFLAAEDRPLFAAMLGEVCAGHAHPGCMVRPDRAGRDGWAWRVAASTVPTTPTVQLVITDCTVPPAG